MRLVLFDEDFKAKYFLPDDRRYEYPNSVMIYMEQPEMNMEKILDYFLKKIIIKI